MKWRNNIAQCVKTQKNPDPLMRRVNAGSKHGQMPLGDEMKVPKEGILPGENPFRTGAALIRALVRCAECPAVEFSPAG
jgi:hypothetical protein